MTKSLYFDLSKEDAGIVGSIFWSYAVSAFDRGSIVDEFKEKGAEIIRKGSGKPSIDGKLIDIAYNIFGNHGYNKVITTHLLADLLKAGFTLNKKESVIK